MLALRLQRRLTPEKKTTFDTLNNLLFYLQVERYKYYVEFKLGIIRMFCV